MLMVSREFLRGLKLINKPNRASHVNPTFRWNDGNSMANDPPEGLETTTTTGFFFSFGGGKGGVDASMHVCWPLTCLNQKAVGWCKFSGKTTKNTQCLQKREWLFKTSYLHAISAKVQWIQHSPSTSMSRVIFPDSTPWELVLIISLICAGFALSSVSF